jgi:hypothetical protein
MLQLLGFVLEFQTRENNEHFSFELTRHCSRLVKYLLLLVVDRFI